MSFSELKEKGLVRSMSFLIEDPGFAEEYATADKAFIDRVIEISYATGYSDGMGDTVSELKKQFEKAYKVNTNE